MLNRVKTIKRHSLIKGSIDNKEMEIIKIRDDFIKLGQALKLAGLADSGVDAKIEIQEGYVQVNGEVEVQRGKKIHPGDIVEFHGKQFKVESIKN